MSFVLRDATVVVNGNTLSTSSQAINIQMTRQEIDDTTILSKGRVRLPGRIDGTFTVRFLQNFTVVHQVLRPLLAADAFPVSLSIPGSPVYSMQAEMFRYQPITGVVGEVAGIDVEFVGEITITDNNITVAGVRAQATATGQSGSNVGSDGSYGSGVYGAGPYGGTVLLTVTGVRAAATATSQPGIVGIQPIIGVRATATAASQSGTVSIMPVVGVQAAATAAARSGSVLIMPIPGVRGSATATAQAGGIGMLTAWDGTVT